MREFLFLSGFVLIRAALLVLVRPVGRAPFSVLGLAFAFGIGFFVEMRGADNSNGVLQISALALLPGPCWSKRSPFPSV